VDSPPSLTNLTKALVSYRKCNKTTLNKLAVKLEISLGTLKNWERGRSHPNRKSWPAIRMVLGHKGGSATLKQSSVIN